MIIQIKVVHLLGNAVSSITMVYEWALQIIHGCASTEDDLRSGRPKVLHL